MLWRANLKENWKEWNLWSQRDHAHQTWCVCIFHWPVLAWIFWANSIWFYFLTPMDYSSWSEGNFDQTWRQIKRSIILEAGDDIPPSLVCMRIYLHEFFEPVLFFDPHGLCNPWSEGKIWPFLKKSKISKTREAIPTKIGLHTFHINLYLHELFEPILFFDPHGQYGPKESWMKTKRSKIFKTKGAMTLNLLCMHISSTSTCINFLSWFYFLTMDCSPWSAREFWPILKE